MEPERNQKIVVLTGASRGIGHATVKKFASENWRVITCSRNPFDDRCPWPGGEENHVQVDLSNPNNTLEAIDEVKKRLDGKLHALVNNAGISPKGDNGERLDTLGTDLSIWGMVFHVNFFASVILASLARSGIWLLSPRISPRHGRSFSRLSYGSWIDWVCVAFACWICLCV